MLREIVLRPVRLVRRFPAFVAGVSISLALGIGVNTSLIGLVEATMLRSLGVASPDGLIWVQLLRPQSTPTALGAASYPVVKLLEHHTRTFSKVTAFVEFQEVFSEPGNPEIVVGEFVTPLYFETLGLQPATGRVWHQRSTASELEGVVISTRLWRRRFGTQTNVVGHRVHINGHPLTIIGVLPDAFRGLQMPSIRPTDVFVPITLMPQVSSRVRDPQVLSQIDWRGFRVVARMAPGVTVTQAQHVLDAVSEEVKRLSPGLSDARLVAMPIQQGFIHPGLDTFAVPIAGILMALSGLVLIVVCANLVNLFLARAIHRQVEMATRASLGAKRWQLFVLPVTEVLFLSLGAGVLAGALTPLAWQYLLGTLPKHSLIHTVAIEPEVGLRLVLLTALISGSAGLLIGIVPALRSATPDLSGELLREGGFVSRGRRSSLVRSACLTAQVSVSSLAVVVAVMFASAAVRLQRHDIGFGNSHAVLFGVDFRLQKDYSVERAKRLLNQLRERAFESGSTRRATTIDFLPLGTRRDPATVRLEGEPADYVDYYRFGDLLRVGPGYFEIVNTPILRGRGFTKDDGTGGPPVVVVSQMSAERLWPGQNPIGKRLEVRRGTQMAEVVGVAGDTDVRFVGERRAMLFYVPFEQHFSPEAQVVVESTEPPAAVIQRMKNALAELDPDVAIVNAASIDDWVAMWMWPYRITSKVIGMFALISLVISLVGVYAVTLYTTAQRTREIGIRVACGASPLAVVKSIVASVAWPVLLGLVGAALLVPATSTVISRAFFRMLDTDGIVIGLGLLFVAFTAFMSACIPAWRSLRRSPAEALRHL
ncbi:MAG TPA: ABC transporter permease [Steroidobacteraceae bacterium]|nr:ABC transporter permease [Steroidobacteraceae bacterium]